MRRTSRRGGTGPDRLVATEAGFALIEVMVSAVLLIVLALSTLSVLDRSQRTSSNNRSRDVAAQIAQSEQDTIRQMPITALAGGYHPGAVIKTIGGIPYSVDSSADWVQDSGGPVTCSTNTGRVEYLQTTTSITWPGMGTIKPVVADGIVAPGVAALGANKGALTVLLSKADGSGTPGITVTAGGVSATTDQNGCAVLGNLTAGNQTLTYGTAGYVDKDSQNVPTPSKVVTIGSGTIAQATGSYDLAGIINVSLVDDQSPAQPARWPPTGASTVSFDHAQRSTPTLFTVTGDPSTPSVVAAAVFPFPSPYKAYVGDCTGNDPSNPLYTGGGPALGAQVNPNQTKALSLTMRRITVNAGSQANILIAAELSDAAMAACSNTTYGKWPTNASGSVTIPVPYGVWKVCANYFKSGTSWYQAKTIVAGASADDPPISTPATTTGTYAARLSTTLTKPSSGAVSPEPTACT